MCWPFKREQTCTVSSSCICALEHCWNIKLSDLAHVLQWGDCPWPAGKEEEERQGAYREGQVGHAHHRGQGQIKGRQGQGWGEATDCINIVVFNMKQYFRHSLILNYGLGQCFVTHENMVILCIFSISNY